MNEDEVIKELEWIGSSRKDMKAKHGIATPKRDLDLIRERLKRAESLYTGKKKEA